MSERCEEVLAAGQRYASLKLNTYKNRIKEDSRDYSYLYLLDLLKREVEELRQAIHERSSALDIGLEAGDVINFASMICDKLEQRGI